MSAGVTLLAFSLCCSPWLVICECTQGFFTRCQESDINKEVKWDFSAVLGLAGKIILEWNFKI
jgi:hypothetical protein